MREDTSIQLQLSKLICGWFFVLLAAPCFAASIFDLPVAQDLYCIRSTPQKLEDAQRLYQAIRGKGPLYSQTIYGRKLIGTDEELEILRLSLERDQPRSWQQLSAKCSQVSCAFEALFGSEEAATLTLLLGLRDRIVLSASKGFPDINQVKATNWNRRSGEQSFTLPEIRKLFQAMSLIPGNQKSRSHFITAHRVQGDIFFRDEEGQLKKRAGFAFGKYHDDAGISRPALMAFGDYTMNEVPETESMMTVIHEWAHHFDNRMVSRGQDDLRIKSGFTNLTDWTLVTKARTLSQRDKWQAKNLHQFVNSYAASSPDEDFAESLAYFLVQPTHLLKVSKRKFESLVDILGVPDVLQLNIGIADWIQKSYPASSRLAQCLMNMDSLTVMGKDGHIILTEAGTNTLYSNNQNHLTPTCLNSLHTELVQKMRSESCQSPDPTLIKARLNELVAESLKSLLTSLKERIPLIDKHFRQCRQQKRFDSRCFISNWLTEIREHDPSVSGIDENSWALIQEKLLELLPSNYSNLVSGLNREVADVIILQDSSVQHALITCLAKSASDFYSDSFLKRCSQNLLTRSTSQGFVFNDVDVNSIRAILDQKFSEPRNNLAHAINQKINPAYNSGTCVKLSCLEGEFTKILLNLNSDSNQSKTLESLIKMASKELALMFDNYKLTKK